MDGSCLRKLILWLGALLFASRFASMISLHWQSGVRLRRFSTAWKRGLESAAR